MILRITIIIFALLSVFLMMATPVLAAPSWWPLVPCGIQSLGQAECTKCDLLKLVHNLIDFVLFGLAPILGTFFFILAGVYILGAGANVFKVEDGKRIFWTTVKALFLIGFAWLITNTFIKDLGVQTLGYQSPDKWYEFTCTEAVPTPVSTLTMSPTVLPVGMLSEIEARRQLAAAGTQVNAQPPQTTLVGIRQATINEIINIKSLCGCSIIITGGTEPGHSSRHSAGYKVDLGINPSLSNYIIQNFTFIGIRNGDGAKQYRDSETGAVFALESDHWDVDVP